jgi:hypothetical protein
MHNELPTLDNLEKRRPDIYLGKTTCVMCQNEKETLDHLLSCKYTEETRKQIWKSTVKKIIENWIPRHQSNKNIQISPHFKDFLKNLGDRTLLSSKNIINFSLGLCDTSDSKNWDLQLAKTGITSGKAKIIFIKTSQFFIKSLRKHIWNPRCEKTQLWEKEVEITRVQKRNRNPDATKLKSQRIQTLNKRPKRTRKKGKPSRDHNEKNILENTRVTIWHWIKEGRKWLNM